jgi:hypothetical protein
VAALRTEAAGHEDAVLKVRIKFSRQLGRVQNKEMAIQDNREEWELEQHTLTQQKEAHDEQMAQHSQALIERDSLLYALHKEVEMADTFQSFVGKEIGLDHVKDNKAFCYNRHYAMPIGFHLCCREAWTIRQRKGSRGHKQQSIHWDMICPRG